MNRAVKYLSKAAPDKLDRDVQETAERGDLPIGQRIKVDVETSPSIRNQAIRALGPKGVGVYRGDVRDLGVEGDWDDDMPNPHRVARPNGTVQNYQNQSMNIAARHLRDPGMTDREKEASHKQVHENWKREVDNGPQKSLASMSTKELRTIHQKNLREKYKGLTPDEHVQEGDNIELDPKAFNHLDPHAHVKQRAIEDETPGQQVRVVNTRNNIPGHASRRWISQISPRAGQG